MCSHQCPKGHELREVLLKDLAEEDDNYDEGAECNSCRKLIQDEDESLRHCDTCFFDLCKGCWKDGLTTQRCPRGHLLREATVESLGEENENEAYADGAACDECNRMIAKSDSARHCDTCSFDLCKCCWKDGMTYQKCPEGHALREVVLKDLAKENPSYEEGTVCNGCGRMLLDEESLRHCDTCDYDLCKGCWKDGVCAQQCPKGHLLREIVVKDLANKDSAYEGGAACDACGKPIRDCDPLRHCFICSYDLCKCCWKDGLCSQKCVKGHALREIIVKNLADEVRGYRDGALCSECEEVIDESDPIRHCDACGYDLCKKCWKDGNSSQTTKCAQCPKGHALREVTMKELAEENPAYEGGAKCDECRRKIRGEDTLRHCDECSYDLCDACSKK